MAVNFSSLNVQSPLSSLKTERAQSAESRCDLLENAQEVTAVRAEEQEQNTASHQAYEKVYARAQSLFASSGHVASKAASYESVSKQLGRQTAQELLSFSTYA